MYTATASSMRHVEIKQIKCKNSYPCINTWFIAIYAVKRVKTKRIIILSKGKHQSV